jgi:hypothetical protein
MQVERIVKIVEKLRMIFPGRRDKLRSRQLIAGEVTHGSGLASHEGRGRMARIGIRMDDRLRRGTWIATLLAILGGSGWSAPCEGAGIGTAVSLARVMIGSKPQLVKLSAGTRITETPPEGWTHSVIKSIPKLKSGDLDTLPAMATKTATMFRTAILADVQGLGLDKQFILARVGIGMCIPGRDGPKEDVVVTADRLQALGLKLSTVEQMVLDAAESELVEARIIASTSTFALLRAPTTLVVHGKHRKVDLYYAFCVDPSTGRLRVGVWSMWPGAINKTPPLEVIDLAAKTTFDCELDVQAKKLLGMVPISWSFAMRKLPPGHKLKVNKPLGEKLVAVANRPISVDTEELEKMLRKILFAPGEKARAKESQVANAGERAR